MLKRFLAAGLALILALGPASQALAVEPGQNEAKRIEASIENPVDNKSMGEKDRDDKKVSEKKVYIVDFEEEKRDEIKKSLEKIESFKLLYEYFIVFSGLSFELDPEKLDECYAIPGIGKIEEAGKMTPMMNNARKDIKVDQASGYLKNLNLPTGAHYDGRGMVISSIDTGIDHRHKDMRLDDDAKDVAKLKKGGKLPGSDATLSDTYYINEKIPHSYNYLTGGKITVEKYDDGSHYYDPHGQHIAGILAANAKNEEIEKENGIKGVAPNAQLLSYKTYSYPSMKFAGDETMFHAMEDSIKHGADVVSVSSGYTGTGLVGEKYWHVIRALRKHDLPVCVATGNFATSGSNTSWDAYANDDLGMVDTGNVTRTAAHEDTIAVGSARNSRIEFSGVNINGKDVRYAPIGAFFNKKDFTKDKYDFIYLGRCQDEDVRGKDLRGKIVVMDRIFTTELKYAFKRVTDKGAKGVVVVNTVSFYNRDDWELYPALGYEFDEKTDARVISISGYDGLDLWDAIRGEEVPNQRNIGKEEDYRIDMKEFNKHKPKLGQEKNLSFKFLDKKLYTKDSNVPAGSTSWGPRTDLMLKPDVSAPGKNIYSTMSVTTDANGNEISNYGNSSGTSMATPVVSASTVIVRPLLKELVKTDVLTKANNGKGIDLVTLTKIMMQNTSDPMPDKTTDNGKGGHLYASPRQQGAGLINVNKAVHNKVFASYQVKGSLGEENSYGAMSLKEIAGQSKNFVIDIHNTSDRDLKFRVKSTPVTTDGIVEKKKLDEEYRDADEIQGVKMVREVHPEIVKDASMSFDQEEFVVKANSSFKLGGSIDVGSAKGQNKFVEGFIRLESEEESSGKENPQPSLSMPFMGFAGDWNHDPIVDEWAWEEGARYKEVQYDDRGNSKKPSSVYAGHGDHHGVSDNDLYYLAGTIQNTEDGNKNLDQDPSLFSLNNDQDAKEPSSKLFKIEPKGIKYNLVRTLLPYPFMLRTSYNAEAKVVANKDPENPENEKLIIKLTDEDFVRGVLNTRNHTARGFRTSRIRPNGKFAWKGHAFNPRIPIGHGDTGYGDDYVAEGDYAFKFEFKLLPYDNFKAQTKYIDVKVDRTKPEILSIDSSNPDEIKLRVKDTYNTIKKEHDKPTLFFIRDQEKNPNFFETKPNKVWLAKAGFIDDIEDRNVEKELSVIRTEEDPTSLETTYAIKGANKGLAGKIIEIGALDPAANEAEARFIKFADQVEDGKLKYEIGKAVEELTAPFTYETVFKKIEEGSIDEKLLKEEDVPSPSQPEKKALEGKVDIKFNKDLSSYRDLKDRDGDKKLKIKTGTRYDFVSDETITVKLYGDYDCNYGPLDDDGLPTHYEDGTKVTENDYTYESVADMKDKGYVGAIEANDKGGYNIRGKIHNVSEDGQLRIESKGWINASEKMDTFNYNPEDKSLEFDLYINLKDTWNGKRVQSYLTIFAMDGRRVSDKFMFKLEKPETKKEKEEPRYLSETKDINEIGRTLTNGQRLSSETVNGKTVYYLSDAITLSQGYALKAISLNPGKNDLEPMSTELIYCDASNAQDGKLKQDVKFEIREGFGTLRYEIYELKLDKNGNAIKDGDSVKLGKMVEDTGKCVYFDNTLCELVLDNSTFNPSKNNKLYIKSSPLVLRGQAGDKGAFMWDFFVNRSLVDSYLIYGDFKTSNYKDFEFKVPVEDRDWLDWSMADYVANGMDGRVVDKDGNNVVEGLVNQYQIRIDNTKPEISLTLDDSQLAGARSIKFGDKFVNIVIKDKVDADGEDAYNGEVQKTSIKINGKDYEPGKGLADYGQEPYEIEVSATDYAFNTSLKKFEVRKDVKPQEKGAEIIKISLDYGVEGQKEDKEINKGEDLTLPSPDFKNPGKTFLGWEYQGKTYKPGETLVFNEKASLLGKWKDEVEKAYTLVEYKLDGIVDKENYKPFKAESGSKFKLPKAPEKLEDGKSFESWIVGGKFYNPGDELELNGERILISIKFKDKKDSGNHGGESPQVDPGNTNGADNRQDPAKEKDQASDKKNEGKNKEALKLEKLFRTAGKDRYQTALEISRKNFEKADTVVLADARNYPDALTASALARSLNAPLLLTSESVSKDLEKEIKRLGAKNITIVGGRSSVSNKEAKFYQGLGNVERIAGADRYETAIKIAERVLEMNKGQDKLIVADGLNYPDALAAGAYAAREKMPIILANGSDLPGGKKLIKTYGIKKALVVGGSNSVGNVDRFFESTTRIAGKNRCETAVKIAEDLFKGSKKIYLASGENFPDALAIGPVGGMKDAPILLTRKDKMPKEVRDYIQRNKIEEVEIIGGENSVSQNQVK